MVQIWHLLDIETQTALIAYQLEQYQQRVTAPKPEEYESPTAKPSESQNEFEREMQQRPGT